MKIEAFNEIVRNWEPVALAKGMTPEEVSRQNKFIFDNLGSVNETCQSVYFKRSKEGPPRSVEFFFKDKTVTVVTHFKQKGGMQPLGFGYQAVVKTSVVTYSIQSTLKPGTIIADKVPNKENRSPELLRSFVREGELTAKFATAANIRQLLAGVHDRRNKEGILLVGMQNTLQEIFKSCYAVSKNQKVAIAKGLTNGLRQLHAQNVVHRDLHMGNCALSYENTWMIHDLGLARIQGELISGLVNLVISSPTTVHDKVHNQQILAKLTDDTWALGLLLYELEYNSVPKFVFLLEKIRNILLGTDKRSDISSVYEAFTQSVQEFLDSFRDDPDNDSFLKELILALFEGKDMHHCCQLAEKLSFDVIEPFKATNLKENNPPSGYIE